jgi:heme a synthase
VAQGSVGFVQYVTDLPIVLVGFHMLGAALVSAGVTWVLIEVREAVGAGYGGDVPGSGEPVTVSAPRTVPGSPLPRADADR